MTPLQYDLRRALAELADIQAYYAQFPFVRRMAVEVGAPRWNDDVEGMVKNITQFVKEKVTYVSDPCGFELVTAPDVMLAEIVQRGRAYGDCDDHVLLLNTMLNSIGVPAVVAAVKLNPEDPEFNHVITVALLRNRWTDIDPCAKFKSQPTYLSKFILQP